MLHFRQEIRGENSDQRSPLAVSTASRPTDDTLRSFFNEFQAIGLDFDWFLYVFHEFVILWAYIVPQNRQIMENILFHNLPFQWSIY